MFGSLGAAYLALALGAFLEGEAVMLAAGALVHAGKLDWPGVWLAGATGSAVWGQAWFHVGRRLGPSLLRRRFASGARFRSARDWLARRGAWVCVGGRFVPGMGTVLPAAVGASGFRPGRFVLLDVLGALIWSGAVAVAGFGAGFVLRDILGLELDVRRVVAVLAVVVALAVAGLAREGWAALTERGERRAVITADDFGLAEPFNEAVEMAHRHGLLMTASLMLSERGTLDAIERARRNPRLQVGLHLTLCEGHPRLSPREVPLLVGPNGEFPGPLSAIARLSLLGFGRRFRRQLEAEIRAQFGAFQATGLGLDHVSGHNNLHLHPTVLPLLLRVAHDFGAKAIRVPYEPPLVAWRAAGGRLFRRLCVWSSMGCWAAWGRRRIVRAGFAVNDYLFGVVDCGAMTRERLLRLASLLPPGTSEIHLHPATRRCAEIERNTPSYQHEGELEALLDPEVRGAFAAAGVPLAAGYRGLLARPVNAQQGPA